MASLLIILWHWLTPFSFSPAASVESATFDILYHDRVIGELVSSRERTGNQEIYRNTTTIRTRVFTQIEVQYQSRVVYQDGILQEATVTSLFNGDVYDNVKTQKVGNDYQFYKDGKLKRTLQGPITFSAQQMYFKEPAGISSAYSEEAGVFHTIKADDKAKYSKINSRGRTNYFYYENQYLKKIELDGGLFEVVMIRK
ncbi:MAG: hypothetical protein H6563_04280 [Lewinellaceae bacterium]|nr:hypothetical protein [Lewinellaceae bacterium]